jgi:hypothetical protein
MRRQPMCPLLASTHERRRRREIMHASVPLVPLQRLLPLRVLHLYRRPRQPDGPLLPIRLISQYFSPGVCPAGYTTARRSLVSVGAATETVATCRPTAYTCDTALSLFGAALDGGGVFACRLVWTTDVVGLDADDYVSVGQAARAEKGCRISLACLRLHTETRLELISVDNLYLSNCLPCGGLACSASSPILGCCKYISWWGCAKRGQKLQHQPPISFFFFFKYHGECQRFIEPGVSRLRELHLKLGCE